MDYLPTLGEKWLHSRGNVGKYSLHGSYGYCIKPGCNPAWRIISVSKWLVTPNYKPFRPFIRGITPVRGLTNHGY